MNSKVDWFFEKDSKWKTAYNRLREIVLEALPAGEVSGLAEELKWGKPCYTYNGKHILLMHGFKNYCALLFHKGVLLKDTEQLLVQQTENVQAARQMRFENLEQINARESVIKAYIYEAVEVEKAGIKVPMKKTGDFAMPKEFKEKLNQDTELKKAFESLTPGRQRGYILYFGKAKKAKTRTERIERYRSKILEGKGLNDD